MQNDVPAGIKYDAVSRFFAENVPGGSAPLTFSLISGGRSNLTYKVESANGTWVLRRPPLGHVLPTAHDMAREFRVLSGVAKVNYPAPKPIALCEDGSVNDYPFYVMEYREGVIIAEEMPEGYADTEERRTKISKALVKTLVELHAIDYDDGGPRGFRATGGVPGAPGSPLGRTMGSFGNAPTDRSERAHSSPEGGDPRATGADDCPRRLSAREHDAGQL